MSADVPHDPPRSVPDLLDALFAPQRVAVAGPVKRDDLRRWGYAGELVAPDTPADVALVTVVADEVVPQLQICARAGTMRAVVLAAGFEGAPGAARRSELTSFLADHPGFRLVGPNCAGTLSAYSGATLATAAPLLGRPPRRGGAGLVFQSGGLGIGFARALTDRGAGFAHFASTGDELDVGALELAIAFLGTPECTAVALFLEGLTDSHFLPVLAEAIDQTGKPVLAVRCGTSGAGRAAAFGHTGRIVGDADIARAALRQAGVHVLGSVDELCDVTTVVSVLSPRKRLPVRVGVVVGAGGAGVLAADEVARTAGVELADLDPIGNPLDVPSLGDPAVFPDAIRTAGAHDGCDAVVAVTTTLAHDYEMVATSCDGVRRPLVFAHLAPGDSFTRAQGERLAEVGVPNVPSVVHAIRALGVWAGGAAAKTHSPSSTAERLGLILSADRLGPRARRWLAPAGVAASVEEAVALAHRFGGAVAVKAEGTHVEHRTEVGAVQVGLRTEAEITAAYAAVAGACEDQVVVQQTAPAGIELLVSVIRDPELGPVALCGLGGVLVELGMATPLPGPPSARRAALLAAPVGRLLVGYRGAPAADVDGLLELIDDLLAAVHDDNRIATLECNPVIVHERGSRRAATIVDISIYLTPNLPTEEHA